MQLSDRGVELIAGFEGFRSCPYWDVNHWSIGFGTQSHQGADCIDREEAERRLRRQVDMTYGAAVKRLKLPLNQNQFDALTSLAYNVGPGVLDADRPVGRALRARQWQKAADALLAYDKAGGVVLEGLRRRRKTERELFLKKPSPPPIRYSTDEQEMLAKLKSRPGNAPKAADWLEKQAKEIMRRARSDEDGWQQHDRGRRYQGIRRALKRYA